MRYLYAKKLDLGDEITIKDTGETTKIHSILVEQKNVIVEVFSKDGWRILGHKEFD